ncbi:hypothetical protein ACFL67_01600, partial [candidate division KSB1 bacterium]
WIILLLHSVGLDGGWGWYEWEEFIKDIDYIEANDFWAGNMDVIAVYIQERNHFSYQTEIIEKDIDHIEYIFIPSDGLDNSMYDQPLTLEFQFDFSNTQFPKISFGKSTGELTEMTLKESKVRLNVLPDEKEYILRLHN